MLLAVIALTILALVFFWLSGRQRQSAGLPGGRIIYADTQQWAKVERPLYDALLNLSGKPDYLVQQGENAVIPVEVKTGRTPTTPHDSHIFQLAAYCLLAERVLHKRPAYGILHYPNRTYAVDYTPALESALLDVLAEMRVQERRGEADRSHEEPARCARCGYRAHCNQRLA